MALEFCPKNANDWEEWLSDNHNCGDGVWLIQYKKGTEKYNISYEDALDSALCYGWIDSTIRPIDEEKYCRYFSKRNRDSCWSRVNKKKVEALIQSGKMTIYGFEAIEIAKQNGSYYIFDSVDNGILPDDLAQAFDKNKKAYDKFKNLKSSEKKHILHFLVRIKTQTARSKNIEKLINDLNLK